MKIVFLGSSDFSVPSLKKLIENGHEILAVVCQPDRPNKRGNKLEISQVKKVALDNDIKVLQFEKIRLEGVEILKNLQPELMIVVSYGQILSQEIIDIPTLGIINVHASLLPKYRGASPIITSVLNGDEKTGVTIMRVEKGIDMGDMILKQETKIRDTETAGELSNRLADMGADLLMQAIEQIKNKSTHEEKQDETLATFTKMIQKEEAVLDFSKPAKTLFNQIRAFNPTPVSYFIYNNEKIKVYESEVVEGQGKYGEIISADIKSGLIICCGQDALKITKLQAPNGKVLGYKDFLNGKSFKVGIKI